MLTSTYIPPKEEELFVDVMYGDLTLLRKISVYGYSINNDYQESKSAVKVYTQIMTNICEVYYEDIRDMVMNKTKGDVSFNFKTEEHENYSPIGHGLFIYTNINNIDKFKIIRSVMEKLGIDDWEIKIFYKSKERYIGV